MADVQSPLVDVDFDAMMKQLNETTVACRRCISSVDDCILSKTGDPDGRITEQLLQKVALLEEQLRTEKERNVEVLNKSQQVETENEKLRKDFTECRKQLQATQEFIVSLTSARSSATTSVDQERIEMLEVQLRIFQEDFESERREHAHDLAKISNLEQTLSLLKRQVSS